MVLDPAYKADLARRINQRITDEWPGAHTRGDGKIFMAGPVNPDGATRQLIDFATRIAIEEIEKD